MKRNFILAMVVISILLCSAFYVFATPEGADISYHGSTRHAAATTKTMSGPLGAYAGNVTNVNITASAVTRTWHGYYGNVSGTLVLQNGATENMYAWTMASPGGKVLASNSTIADWSEVYCWNQTVLGTYGLTPSEWNTKYGATGGDYDNITNTFSGAYAYTTFYIGNKQFTAAGTNDNHAKLCPALALFNQSGAAGTNQYEEIILQEGAWGAANDDPPLIYVSLIEPSSTGFDGTLIDFQMMVPDDGHGTDVSITTYYFYVELESS